MTETAHDDTAVVPLWKLTRHDRTTSFGCVWTLGEWREFNGHDGLCTSGWSHWYLSPQLAVLLNPIHANFPQDTLRLWRGEGVIGIRDHQLKVGSARARILEEIPLPTWTATDWRRRRTAFGLAAALAVYPLWHEHDRGEQWSMWALAPDPVPARRVAKMARDTAFRVTRVTWGEAGLAAYAASVATEAFAEDDYTSSAAAAASAADMATRVLPSVDLLGSAARALAPWAP